MEIEKRKRNTYLRKKEKEAYKREQKRERIKHEIEKDKLERKANQGKLTSKLGVDGYNPDAQRCNGQRRWCRCNVPTTNTVPKT